MLANNQGNFAEALKLLDEAIRIAGPNADVLDTRALVHLGQGNAALAIADLKKGLDEQSSPTTCRLYLHLAEAEHKADNLAGARMALKKAEESGFDVNRLSPSDRRNYSRLIEQVK